MTAKIDAGNRILGLDLIPRSAKGELLDIEQHNANVIELFRVHQLSAFGRSGGPGVQLQATLPSRSPEALSLLHSAICSAYHLLIRFTSATPLQLTGDYDLHFSLFVYDFTAFKGDFACEDFIVRPSSKLKQCFFTDLNTEDVKKDIFWYARWFALLR
eukprot:m.908216 g.908216  ORF g.908216 m.908216 type:complete len:158 (-) comp60099_c0_seq3:742-1215(-)